MSVVPKSASLSRLMATAKAFAKSHPYVATSISLSLSMIALPGLFISPVLALLGFGGPGVTAGSIAASIQAAIGNVAGGSLFAALQSAGAGGAGMAAVNAVVQAAVGLLGWLVLLLKRWSGKGRQR